jgi:hypothetical protein
MGLAAVAMALFTALRIVQCFLVEVGCAETFGKVLVQAVEVAGLQPFFLDAKGIFGGGEVFGLGCVLCHHHVQRQLGIGHDLCAEGLDLCPFLGEGEAIGMEASRDFYEVGGDFIYAKCAQGYNGSAASCQHVGEYDASYFRWVDNHECTVEVGF